jgi:hypothetical protein
MVHEINIGIHASIGTIAIVVGILALYYNKRTLVHKKWGFFFMILLSGVIITGFIGFLFFRNDPFLSMLTILSAYVGYAGFRSVKLREKRATILDAVIALGALSAGISHVLNLVNSQATWSATIVMSTLIALALVTTYDLLKYFFLYPFLKGWWLYEHIYKMISAFSALVSAFAGNVLKDFHPYSQIVPSAICLILIIYFIGDHAIKKGEIEFIKGKIIDT